MNRLLLGTLLGAGALASGLALWLQRDPAPAPRLDTRADYRLIDFEMTALEQDGSEGFTVTGPRMERDLEGMHTTFEAPRFSFPARAPGQRWNARADHAWIGPDHDEVRLTGGVELLGPPDRQGQSVHFESQRLSVFPEREQARSDAAVTVHQGRSILRATGLDVDMRAQRYELHADVHATLHPDPARRPAADGSGR